ncbi:MAG: prepilin-type N-terminal cleavage/methylation domain-containing protein [Anaerohalosphaeraceae bacterium]
MNHRRAYSFWTRGFTLLEVIVTLAILVIPILAVTILAAGGSRSVRQTYNSIHKPIRQDALAIVTAFSTVGRKSNRSNYTVYKIVNGTYTVAQPLTGQELASGSAVEFRYWQEPFNPANAGSDVLEVTNTGTHYALFYLEGRRLKVDYGRVVNGVGGISGGLRRTGSLLRTVTLTEFVNISRGTEIFSHNVVGGVGMGSVRMNLTLTDNDGDSEEVKTSVLLRMNWPR